MSSNSSVLRVFESRNVIWDVPSQSWIAMQQPILNAGSVTVSGSIIANAGTNLNTSLLALESGGNLATIATNTPPLGQALAAASTPVVLPTSQITTLTPPAAITNFALETGGNLAAAKTDLDAIKTSVANIPAQGQALAAASTPVVLPAAQITTLTPPAAITNFALETGGNLATVATDVAPLVNSGAGGYVRQDSTATIAKETGGNLATAVTSLSTISSNQTNKTQLTQLTDGTNVGTIKASGIIPLLSDTATVVTLRDAPPTGPAGIDNSLVYTVLSNILVELQVQSSYYESMAKGIISRDDLYELRQDVQSSLQGM